MIIISQIDRRKKKNFSDSLNSTQIGTDTNDRSPTGRGGEINHAASRDWRSMESFCWIQAGNTNLFPNSHFNPLAGVDGNTTLGKSNASIFFV